MSIIYSKIKKLNNLVGGQPNQFLTMFQKQGCAIPISAYYNCHRLLKQSLGKSLHNKKTSYQMFKNFDRRSCFVKIFIKFSIQVSC